MNTHDQCPRCGSSDAVPKSTAWDALTKIPPKLQNELDRLREMESAAAQVVSRRGEIGSPLVVVQYVPADALDALQSIFAQREASE